MVTWEHAIAFVMCLMLMGLSVHLLLRRSVKSTAAGDSSSVNMRL